MQLVPPMAAGHAVAAVGRRLPRVHVMAPDDPVAVVGHREVVDALSRDVVDRLGDDPVLVEGLGEVDDVVADDVGAVVGERVDVVREARLAEKGGRERQRGARGEVVDDLQHRPPLVRLVRVVLEHLHRRRAPARVARAGEVAGRYVAGGVRRGAPVGVERVREHPHLDAGAVDVELGLRDVGFELGVALRDHARGAGVDRARPGVASGAAADHRRLHLVHGLDARRPAHRAQVGDRDRGGDRAVAGDHVEHVRARYPEPVDASGGAAGDQGLDHHGVAGPHQAARAVRRQRERPCL